MKKNSWEALTSKIVVTTFSVFLFSGCASKSDSSKQLSYKNISSQKVSSSVISFSPSGKFVAKSAGKSVEIIDASSGKILKTLTPESGTVFSLAFDAYEQHIALGMYRKVQIWNFENQKLIKTIEAHKDIVTHVAFDPTGNILATGSRGADFNINFWNTANWEHKNTLSMKTEDGYANNIQAKTFSQDGQYFSATGLDKTVHVWNARTGKKLAAIINNSKITALSLSPTGELVAAGDEQGKLKVWKVSTQERLTEVNADESPIQNISFNQKGDFLATAGGSNIKLWNTTTWDYERDIGFNKPDAVVTFNAGNLAALVLPPKGAVALYELTNQSYVSPVIKTAEAIAPMISIISPEFNSETDSDSITVSGKAHGAVKIEKVRLWVNGNALSEKTRDLSISSNDPNVVTFKENVTLTKEGSNEIKISAIDINGLETTEIVSVKKISDTGRIFGAVIGVSNYKNQEVNSLKYAASDAEAFYSYLKDDYGISPENLFMLKDSEATNGNIRDLLGVKLKKIARKNDTVIIYYAGHGAPEIDTTVSDEDGLEKYLLPFDADPESLYSTAIPMEEVSKILERIKAERVILVADTCFSGASDIKPGRTISSGKRTRSLSTDFLKRVIKSKGRVVLTASGANERSIEDDKLQGGVFTHYLIRALKGEADSDNNGEVTVEETYKFISNRVADATEQEQHPMIKMDESGHLILGKVKN